MYNLKPHGLRVWKMSLNNQNTLQLLGNLLEDTDMDKHIFYARESKKKAKGTKF
jgi:hypothetical protein